MEVATIMLALAGNDGNTVPKFDVTPSEVAVLEAIHGEGSVSNIDIVGNVTRSGREERARLAAYYGKPPGSREVSAVDVLFPGVAAPLFNTFKELDLPDQRYGGKTYIAMQEAAIAAAQAEQAAEAEAEAAAEAAAAKPAKAKRGKKAEPEAPAEPVEGAGDEEVEGVGEDMPDAALFQ